MYDVIQLIHNEVDFFFFCQRYGFNFMANFDAIVGEDVVLLYISPPAL